MQPKRGRQSKKGIKTKKKGNWTQEQMNTAYKAGVENCVDIAAAVRQCGVPRRTLGDRVNQCVALNTTNGRPSALSPEDEKEIIRLNKTILSCQLHNS